MLKTNSKVKEIDCHQELLKDTALGIILWEKLFFMWKVLTKHSGFFHKKYNPNLKFLT